MLNYTYNVIQKFTKHVLKRVCCHYKLLWQVKLKCLNISERKPSRENQTQKASLTQRGQGPETGLCKILSDFSFPASQ